MIDLGSLGGSSSYAEAMNDRGQVVGDNFTNIHDNLPLHAFSWTQATGMIDLDTFGGSASYARAVNDGGQVAGFSDTPGNAAQHAVMWQVGKR